MLRNLWAYQIKIQILRKCFLLVLNDLKRSNCQTFKDLLLLLLQLRAEMHKYPLIHEK